MERSIEAILFDMDGTLVDSKAAVERAWVAVAEELSLDTASVLAHCHGRPAPDTVRSFWPDADEADVDRAAARQLELQYTDLDDVTPMPGLRDVLHAIDRHGLPWAVVTSADVPLANARLLKCDIQPPVLVTVDDIHHGKPDPEGYLTAATRLGVAIDRCVVVEDSGVGAEAGRRAGAQVAALNGLECDIPLRTLHDLAAWIDDHRRLTPTGSLD